MKTIFFFIQKKKKKGGNKDVVKLLLDYQADTEIKDCYSKTALHYSVQHGIKKKITQIKKFNFFFFSILKDKLMYLNCC